MEVVVTKVVMAALMALLAINGTSAAGPDVLAGAAAGTKKLPFLPFLPSLPNKPELPVLPVINPSGVCPAYTTLNTFTSANLVGTWFVYHQSHNLAETGWTCKQIVYGPLITPTVQYSHKLNGVMAPVITGTYTWPNTAVGAWSVQLSTAHVLGADTTGKVNQFVVASDITNFMIIRSCTFFPAVPGLLGFNIEYVYVLTRVRAPAAAVMTAITAAATAAGISSNMLQAVVQTGC